MRHYVAASHKPVSKALAEGYPVYAESDRTGETSRVTSSRLEGKQTVLTVDGKDVRIDNTTRMGLSVYFDTGPD
jgi:hypothetical protein